MKKYIETGEIVGTHGVAGEVRINPWSDSPEFLTAFRMFYTGENGENPLKAERVRAHGNVVLAKFEGVDTVEKALAMRSKVLYIDRGDAALSEGTVFVCDLIGCRVYEKSGGEQLGVITDVIKTGANDVWQIENDGKQYLFPAVGVFIESTDTENGRVVIDPPKGIFDDELDEV